ncbi:MAG: serine/threonine-protein kinase [Nanoarchaeota archaeon]
MSIDYVIEKLEKLEDLTERRAEAHRLSEVFRNEMPSGMKNPRIWNDDLSDSQVKTSLKRQDWLYKRIVELCEGEIPESLNLLYKRFKKNSRRSLKLLRVDESKRGKLKLTDLFPYWSDFEGEVRKLFHEQEIGAIEIDLIHKPQFIAQGGFGEVYKAHKKGTSLHYALKLFHPKFRYHREDWALRRRDINDIRKNIGKNLELSFETPFIPIRMVSGGWTERDAGNGGIPLAYVSDFFNGDSVGENLIDDGIINHEIKGRVVLAYAEMLKKLHGKCKVFIDNNLEGVLFNDEEIRICDIDSVTDVDGLEDRFYVHHIYSASRELELEQKPGFISDLESFALMTHYLFTKFSFVGSLMGVEKCAISSMQNSDMAKKNSREYPKKFASRLPNNLSQVVAPLIKYPRDETIKIDDFISAVKQDYRF